MDRIPASFIIALLGCSVLAGCAAYGRALDQEYTDSLFATDEQREAVDRAACERLGAKPGTDIFIQCMLSQQQRRTIRNAGH